MQASVELKRITTTLCETNESAFTSALDTWYTKWLPFLKERTTDPVTGRWHHTHKRLRSAYRSLRLNLPYLFTYQKYPDINIPNTTNSLDGCFAYLKELVRIHRGSKRSLKRKIIEEVLWREKSPKKWYYAEFSKMILNLQRLLKEYRRHKIKFLLSLQTIASDI